MFRVVLTLIVIGLAVYALSDLAGARSEETGGLPKWVWAVIIVLLPVVGAVAWILFRRSQRGGSSSRPGPRPQRPGPVAPDDDPEFLWRLDQERRRRERGPHPDGQSTDGGPQA